MTQISVSTAFFPAAILPGSEGRTDLIIYTCDSVFFYCHQSVLRTRSTNNFGFLLPIPTPPSDPQSARSMPASIFPEDLAQQAGSIPGSFPSEVTVAPSRSQSLPAAQTDSLLTIFVQEESVVFNLVLHMVYGMSCERYGPTIQTVAQALACLPAYGLKAPGPNHDIWTILLRQAPRKPFQVYALGAAHAVDSLCTLASQYTLALPLTDLTEAEALTMGSIYLRRFIFLHLGREDALRRTIRTPPAAHDGTAEGCSRASQAAIRQGWLATVAEVLTGPEPQNIEVGALLSQFAPLASLQCQKCKENVQRRIAAMIQDWVRVKRTI